MVISWDRYGDITWHNYRIMKMSHYFAYKSQSTISAWLQDWAEKSDQQALSHILMQTRVKCFVCSQFALVCFHTAHNESNIKMWTCTALTVQCLVCVNRSLLCPHPRCGSLRRWEHAWTWTKTPGPKESQSSKWTPEQWDTDSTLNRLSCRKWIKWHVKTLWGYGLRKYMLDVVQKKKKKE